MNLIKRDLRFSSNKKRYVDISNLPKRGKNIDWSKSIGYVIPFKSDTTDGEFVIEDYCNKMVTMSFNGEILKPIKNCNLLQANINSILGDLYCKSIDTKYIKKRIYEINPNIDVVGEYKKSREYILCRCKKCNHTWDVKPNLILSKKQGCPSCSGRVVCNYDNHNSLYITRPDLRKYFINELDMLDMREYSNKSAKLKCPDCGTERRMEVSKLSYYGFNCKKCGDGISYPEKFSMNVIDQLSSVYEISSIKREFSEAWTNKRRYDIAFEFNKQRYIIELDGGWHYEDNNMSGISREKAQKIDREKDLMAIENGFMIIRINCYYPSVEQRHDFIKENILNSHLSKMFDLSIINWNNVEKESITSRQLTVWNLKKDNPNITVGEINKITGISRTSIRRYLINGNDMGICKYNYSKSDKGLVYIFKNGNLMFNEGMSGKAISENSVNIFGTSVSKPTINGRLKRVGLGVMSEPFVPSGSNDKYTFIRIPKGTKIEDFYYRKTS